MATPPAEISVDEALVRALLAQQRPDLAALPLRIAASGWDNWMVRAGGEWAIRLPRRALGARLLESELRWLPELAARLPLPVPVPVFAGEPGGGYPWRWSVTRWLPGRMAAEAPPTDAAEAACSLGKFLAALHQPAPPEAPSNPTRGGPLATCKGPVIRNAQLLRDTLDEDMDQVLKVWEHLHDAPPWTGPALWLHGDLHLCNILTPDGRISAVIDFGDLTSGDPATDLAVAWMLFGESERALLTRALSVSEHTWRRAAGWALHYSLFFLTADPRTPLPGLGRTTLRAVLKAFF
jgi:aminoglycoside phosphotransferase (APT) family kinase protein